jgi:DNA protecting protein DprA
MTGTPIPEEPGSAERDFEEAAQVAALAGLPGMGPATLLAILRDRSPGAVWDDVLAGRIERPPPRRRRPGPLDAGPRGDRRQPDAIPLFGSDVLDSDGRSVSAPTRRAWAETARRLEPLAWWGRCSDGGIRVTWPGRPDYPDVLAADPQPPGALFWRGRIEAIQRPCVAIVGTRNATPDGRRVAFEMGRDLTDAGVCVVSGLALGIDGAAHAGAVASVRAGGPGATVGVAASGVDVPYPRRHRQLWREVTDAGAVLSENPPGRPAQAWRFPTRNRIIAGLARIVVIVESHERGGSLITAEAAIERGVEVRVVPGPVHSPASAGSNQLLYDGPGPVRHAQDVLDALGDFRSVPTPQAGRPVREAGPPVATGTPAAAPRPPVGPLTPAASHAPAVSRPSVSQPLEPTSQRVLEAVGWVPASVGQIMARSGLDAAGVVRVLDDLAASGHATAEAGWWRRMR